MDSIIENKHFYEMVEYVANLKVQNNQLAIKVEELFSKNNYFETEMSAMRKENEELLNHMKIIQKQNQKFLASNCREKFNTKKQLDEQHTKNNRNLFDEYKVIKKVEKRILVSDPQYTHSLELKLQDLNTKVDNIEMKHTNDLNSLQQNLQSQITDVLQHSNHGNVYIRWGRTTCPNVNGTDLVYLGYSGGSWYGHTGAASNYLCMPKDPEFLSSQLYTLTGWEGFVYGVEYKANFNGGHFDHDAPCAACKSDRTAIMMIPARQHCDSGWTFEYSGFLVSGPYAHKAATEYVCLDGTPENEEHDVANDNGAVFLYVFSKCGSLPCAPYKNNGPLPCVVCSK